MERDFGVSAAASRRHPRARVDLPVELGEHSAAETNISGRCVDLSIGGMRVSASSAAAPGTRFTVHLDVAERSPVDLAARIVWSESYSSSESLIGLAFEDSQEAESRLAPIVSGIRAQHSWGAL